MKADESLILRPKTRGIGAAGARLLIDRTFRVVVSVAALLSLALVAAIVYELTKEAWPAIQDFGVRFIWSKEWNPPKERFGALPFIAGTLISSILALVF